jgi:hypothetical protein
MTTGRINQVTIVGRSPVHPRRGLLSFLAAMKRLEQLDGRGRSTGDVPGLRLALGVSPPLTVRPSNSHNRIPQGEVRLGARGTGPTDLRMLTS